LYTIKTIEEKLPSILDDFKKYYVFYNKNPGYDEYKSIFENLKANITDIENQLFKISNKVDSDIANTSKQLLQFNKLIEKERARYSKLKSQVAQYNNKYNGSKELISNYKEIYNLNYLRNIFMFLGIIIAIVTLLQIFTKKPIVNNVSS
jgi:septation ring formation regulator EzrA